MLLEDITSDAMLAIQGRSGSTAPIINDYVKYFSKHDVSNVLVITDEKIEGDLRVIHQIAAISRISSRLTVLYVRPKEKYSEAEKKKLGFKINKVLFKRSFLFPAFWLALRRFDIKVPWGRKSRQGLYNDNYYLIDVGIDVSEYSLVVCNNLISINAIKFNPRESYKYIYDVHEFEVFRNRKTQSIQRSFLLYIRERYLVSNLSHILTISKHNIHLLSCLYNIPARNFSCIYNRNFIKQETEIANNSLSSDCKKEVITLIYVGNVDSTRGLDIISQLSLTYKILVIVCSHKEEAIDFLKEYGCMQNITFYFGMDYTDFLVQHLKKCKFAYFLIPIHDDNFSYKNALPNKFFQAQALGLPILVCTDTYLSNLVEKYNIGIVMHKDLNLYDISRFAYRRMCGIMSDIIECEINNGKI